MVRVTALRVERRDRVAVELDGAPWRVLPADVVVRTGLAEGRSLDRQALRSVRRELQRHDALARATRALRHRDVSRAALDERLERAGATTRSRADALETLERTGAVDDRRLAETRAESLAGRGYGDAAIRSDLAQRRVADEVVDTALAALEAEPARARRVVKARGASAKTASYLGRRGFSAEAIETAVGGLVANDP